MADIKDKKSRSINMAHIRGKDTKPELYIRKLLFAKGYRYRLHTGLVPGHPDLWMKKYNTAIFINGCFWHRHLNCTFTYHPKSRVEFWEKKFAENVERDKRVYSAVLKAGIKCLVIWECTIKKMQKSLEYKEQIFQEIEFFLNGSKVFDEL